MTTLDQSLTPSRDATRAKPLGIARRDALWPSTLARAAARLLSSREEAVDEVLELSANSARSFRPRRGLFVEVLEGSVLLTQSGDPDDHVLGAGERRRFGGSGVAAMAFTPSRVRIRTSAAGGAVSQSLAWNGATSGSSSR